MRTTRWAVLTAAMCSVIAVAAVAYAAGRAKAAPVAEVVRAKRFELVDGQGKVRALLSVQPDGASRFEVLDKDRKARAVLRLYPDGTPVLEMLTAGGEPRVSLAGSESMPSLGMGWKGQQGGKLNLGFNAGGVPQLYMTEPSGLVRVMLTMKANGDPMLRLANRDGRNGVELGAVWENPEAQCPFSMELSDKDGRTVWKVP